MAFFTFLPAMHERYLLPAVIISLVCFAVNPTKVIYPIALTFISAFNLAMCLGIKTNSVWPAISWVMLAAFCYGIMELLFARAWIIFIKDITTKLFAFRTFFVVFFAISNLILCSQLINATKIHKLQLNAHQVALTQFTIQYNRQDYGSLNINKSVNGTVLTVAGKRFLDGLGTHANSQIDYMLPETAQELSFIVGLDDEIESASVIFSVWGDEKLLWQSKPYYGAEKNLTPVALPINAIRRLSLRVSGINDISGDHADWIQPFITLSQK
jgi:hypothetical protein